uniref:Uncharacterized protein n=1 Tax=viral metagenome TaxID=1070528 RepID=A0A6M3J2W3_9ZZZZ
MELLKIGFLFLGVLLGISLVIRAWYDQTISFIHLLLVTIGWSGFIYLQWLR